MLKKKKNQSYLLAHKPNDTCIQGKDAIKAQLAGYNPFINCSSIESGNCGM